METIWMWAAQSFTSPGDLSAIDLGATTAMLAWGFAALTAVRRFNRPLRPVADARQEFDEAA